MRIKVLSGGRKSIELPLSDAELNFQMRRIGIEETVSMCRLVEVSEEDNPLHGSIALRITEPYIEANNGVFQVSYCGGKATEILMYYGEDSLTEEEVAKLEQIFIRGTSFIMEYF